METETFPIIQIYNGHKKETPDILAREEFLEIYVNGRPYALCMRLPGDDDSLIKGYCFSEGLIQSEQDILDCEASSDDEGGQRLNVVLKETVDIDSCLERKDSLYISQSSTGLGGRKRIQEAIRHIDPVHSTCCLTHQDLFYIKGLFESKMEIFSVTGCTHACSIFSPSLELVAFAEDVGRHNAFDKAIGKALSFGALYKSNLCLVSSRLSFEMVQKAGMCGTEILAGFSSVTSMALTLAADLNMTLIGFLRDQRFNIYTHPDRILFDE